MDFFIVIFYDPRLDNQTELKAFIRKKNKKLYYPSYKIVKCSVYRDHKLLTKHVNMMTAVICQLPSFFLFGQVRKTQNKVNKFIQNWKSGKEVFIKVIFSVAI